MNLLQSINKAAAENYKWVVMATIANGTKDAKVLVYRPNAPFEDRRWSLHDFNKRIGFYNGQYDLTDTEASGLFDELGETEPCCGCGIRLFEGYRILGDVHCEDCKKDLVSNYDELYDEGDAYWTTFD